MDAVISHLKDYIEELKSYGRKRFDLADAERHVTQKAGGISGYTELGGYNAFCHAVGQMQQEGVIKPVAASPYNGLIPALKTRWHIAEGDGENGWPDSFILQASDCLDMSGYTRNPGWQTASERKYVEAIYGFLKQASEREWASCEERCLELFGNEKFLSTGARQVLTRLNLSYDDLKMKKYGWMFTYWTRGKAKAGTVVVLENHSTFYSFKRCAEEGIPVFSLHPDLLVFGDGKRIVRSLEFLDEIADSKSCRIRYFGDVDPEGWLIYRALKAKYPHLDISLLLPAYEFLLTSGKSYPMGDILQYRKDDVLKAITDEFESSGKGSLNAVIRRLWEEGRRIPQELVTYERLKTGAAIASGEKP